MKKLLSAVLALCLALCSVFALSGCAKKGEGKYDIALITDGAAINDKAYNQNAWDGVKSYADAEGLSCRYFQPNLEEDGTLSVDTIESYIALAVNSGAKSIVLPGEMFAVAAYEIAPTYRDIEFILVDAFPHSRDDTSARLQSNVMCIHFNLLQAGFLAGYSAVLDGCTKLGYLGSVNADASSEYGAGFVQGAGFAADEKGIPVLMDYAEDDSPQLDYDYSFTVRPVYRKADEVKNEKTFRVTVVDGSGSGVYTDGENVPIIANPAPAGKAFDHWELKSDTEGVKDRKVNISSKKDAAMNLLVGDCDCTITAVWKDADASADGDTEEETDIADGRTEAVPTFDVTVENGTGSGSYAVGETVTVTADAPQEGYMFYKWENTDRQGLSTGIAMENEYCYTTNFAMVDRYASVVEKMFDEGTQAVFGGGNPMSDAIFTATRNFDYPVYAIGAGTEESAKGNCLASVVNDYGAAVQLALRDFKGGTILSAGCENNCIYVTGRSLDQYQLDENGNIKQDKDGNDLLNEAYNADFSGVYDALAENKIPLKSVQPGADVRKASDAKCLTLNYWIK